MNQKITLRTFLFGLMPKKENQISIKSNLFLLLLTLLLLTVSITDNFAETLERASFPIRTVKTFNKKVFDNLSHLNNENLAINPQPLKGRNTTTSIAPCPGGSGVIGGKAFQDFNYNGVDDQTGAGLEGIEVYIIGCGSDGNSQAVSSTITDNNGEYFFSGLSDGENYRVEFIIPQSMSFLQSGFNGADSRTTVQFLTSPTCGANIGLANPADFCEEDPSLAIPCFVNGDPMAAGSGSANEDALVLFKTSYEKTNPKPTTLSTASEIGATWGITYHKESKRLFVSAFLKRHVGLGSLGLGGLYQIDLKDGQSVTSPFIDVNSIGINVGTFINNSARGLSANINIPSNDTQAFSDVGKKGIGGMCMSEDGSLLYLINLTEKKLHSIKMGSGTPTNGDVQSYFIPNPACSGGAFRPFAVRVNNGKVYVGGVCDAENSGNKSDLRAVVYRLDESSFIEVLNFSLDYTKGLTSRSCDDYRGWFPWTTHLPEPCFVSGSTNNVIVHPTPQLTAFEFDSEGDLILGFTDRMGNQLGFLNYPPNGTDPLYSVFTGGDILKAGKNQDGSFTIENNATAGNNTTSGVGNSEGPGGGEFFNMDVYDIAPGVPRPHSETAQGGLALIKGTGQVITTALDPFSTFVNSGGVNYLNNKTGEIRDPGYVVFRSSASSISTFSKANGLGDVVALCGEAPIEIGGRIWVDANENGIQDPCENPFSGVKIALYSMDGTINEVVETNSDGEYYFNGGGATIPDIQANTTYYVVIGYDDQVDNVNGALLDSFFLTNANVGMAPNPDLNDSDGMIGGVGVLNNAIQGWPSIIIHTGNVGSVSHDNDAGFFVNPAAPKANITGFVWNDLNENGLQNEGELGIPGVDVDLLDGNENVVATTITDGNGNYTFLDAETANYSLDFDATNDPIVGDNFAVTLQDVGSDDNLDSDIDPTDSKVGFSFDASDGNAEYDAGYTLPLAQIAGLAFDDKDRNGLQGGNEPMISGVTVTLFNGDGSQVASRTTSANGTYVFNEIMGGSYYVVFEVSTNTMGITTYEGTIQDAGDDDFDSDVDSNTGRTPTFTFNPKDGNSNYDAGYFEGTGSITGMVFNDLNENGLQDVNEPGIGGVEVIIIGSNGITINGTTTGSDGIFIVDDIPSGNVTVLFDPNNNATGLENFTTTIKDANNNQNDGIDSDINPNKEADSFEFIASEGADIDAGFFEPVDPVMIGDFVFKDCNENGIQDGSEVGVPNIPITLSGTNHFGEAVRMEMITNSMGKYTFVVPRPGTYSLNFDIPEGVTGLSFSPKGQGGNNGLDSDVNPISGATGAFTIASGESNLNIDAGVIDKSPPLIFNVPPDVTVDCNDIPNPPNSVKGVDNCDPSIEVTFSQRIIDEGSCPYTIERTWTAVDDCGNSATRTQRITVTDTEAPVITLANPLLVGIENGGEVIFECDALPEFTATDVNVIDNCSDVTVKFVDLVREQGNCEEDGFIVKMTCGWSAEDDCGNKSEYLIVIFVVDTKSPTLNNVPEDLTINLDQGQFVPPVANTVTATDNCDEFVKIEFEETQIAGVCGFEITRTWTGFDNCGNKTIESQKLTLLEDCTCPDELVSKTLVWDAACDGSVGGMINLDLTADVNKYTISIAPNVGHQSLVGNRFTDLPPGNYVVTVKYDALEDCSETFNFTVNTATPTTISIVSQTQADCFTANGSVILAPNNLTYQWSDGGTGGQRNDLAAGEYIVSFTDENMCVGSQAIIIINPDGCECIDFKVKLLWEIMPTCNGFTNGQVDIEIVGGTAPYTYLWQDGQTTKDLFGVAAGSYYLIATDVNGCTATLSGELGQPDAIKVVETLMNGACGEKGAIDIFVSGGTPPYNYSWSNGATTEDLTNLFTGTYSVVVTDANDCQGNLTINVNNAGDINIQLSSINPTCFDGNNGSVSATVTGGALPYTYEWSNGETSSSINNLAAGTYAVMVTDATGCKGMAEITLTAPRNININLTASTPECDAETGSISLEVSGGTSPYTYAWDFGASTQNVSNLTAGTYGVTVIDANGCTGSSSASVSINSTIIATATTLNPACGGENGSITLEVSGGRSAYSYNWSNGATSKDLNNVAPGNYKVTITDSNDCSVVISADIQSATDLSINNSPISPSCAGEAGGSIFVTISGGTPPYTYRWTNGETTKDISNLMGGEYTLTVTDANGCIITTTALIDTPSSLSATAIPTNPQCLGETGSIDLTVSGGTGNYSYQWDFGATSEDISGLLSGDYIVTVTDGNGCQMMTTATINIPTAIEGTTIISSPSCSGEGGTIDLTVVGGTAPYTFGWSNGAGTQDLQDAAPGSYNVLITDANGCTTLVSATIESTAGINITQNISQPTCAGEAGGSIDINVTGGTAPYSYNWSNGSNTEDITSLMPGGYSVIVSDANGCQLTENYTLEAPKIISVKTDIQKPDCNGGNGGINITISGGTAPYSFAWSNGITTEDLNDVTPGSYTNTITDANGCTFVTSANITAPSALTASTQVKDQDCVGDGTIDLTVSGGTPPYNYLWSNGSTSEDLNKVGGGSFTVIISDANNCKLTHEVSVQSTGGIAILVSGTAPTCPNASNGSLSLEVNGGTLPYSYQWSNGSQATGLNNIPAGSYSVTVTDAKGCSLVGPAVLDPAPAIITSVVAVNPVCSDGTGNIDLTASGGSGNLTYAWSNGASTEDLSGLAAGIYSVIITDASGCTQSTSATIVIPTPLNINAFANNPGCDGSIGAISVTVSGGTPPYKYSWSNGALTQNLNNVAAGNYTVTVADANGCVKTANASIELIDNISIKVDGSADPTCYGGSDGFINLTVSGGMPPYSYQWTNGATSEDINGLAAGFYAVTISDSRDCKIVLDALLSDPEDINISAVSSDPKCPGDVGSINITVMGGTPPYQYIWTNGETSQDINNLTPGNYQVNVTDAKGCSKLSPNITIVQPADFSISLSAIDIRCYNESNGQVLLTVSRSGNYTYQWSNGATSKDLIDVAEGTYSVIVTNSDGCQKSAEAVVNMPPSLKVSMTFSDPQCPNDLGAINIDVTGGTPPYSFAWSNGATTEDVSDLPAGRHSVVVTDAKGCTLQASADIKAAIQIIATISTTGETCTGNDGLIDLSVSGGSSPYTYEWNNGATSQDLEGFTAGNYSVTIYDANGCFISETATIEDNCECPSPSIVDWNFVTNSRCGKANGKILITVKGDLKFYQFQWSPDVGTQGADINERADLPAGNYTVTVSYGNKAECSEVLRLRIGNRDGIAGSVISTTPATCGNNDGKVVLSPEVNYFWPDGTQSKTKTNLAPGVYEIRALDASGCESFLSITITQEICPTTCDLTVEVASIKSPDCAENKGYINLNVSGGTAPYTYNWDNNSIGNIKDPQGLSHGNYSVTVNDANGCTAHLMVTLNKPDCGNPTTCNIMLSLQSRDLTCDGDNTGSIGVNVFNGKTPLTYKWSNGANSDRLTGLAAGMYRLEVIDADGCRAYSNIEIRSPGRLIITQTRNVIDCERIETKLNVMGGRAPYSWQCEGQSGSMQDPLNFASGTYNCIITDASGCSVNHTLVIEDYQPLGVIGVVTNTTCGNHDGSIDLTPTGGTAPYTFEWGWGLFPSEDQDNLGPHTYPVTVTDATNCTATSSFTIENCGGESFGFIAVTATSIGEQNIKVVWQTEYETVAGIYTVQHSTDGENFEVIGLAMEGKGPIDAADYEMQGEGNFGKNYFQIKYLDADGNEYLSDIVEVMISIPENTSRSSIPAIVYPNPAGDEFVLDFAGPLQAKVIVSITDTDGVLLERVILEPGTEKRVFNILPFEAGIYNVTLEQRRKRLITYRLIKVMK